MNQRVRPDRLAALVILAAAAVVGAACDVMFQGMNAQATDTWQRTYKLESGGRVQITNPNGTIEVTPSADATTVEVVAERRVHAATEDAARQELKNIQITEEATPNEIRLDVPRPGGEGMHFGRSSHSVSFKVKVPTNAAVRISTRNGEVHVTGLAGPVKAESTNGSIVCDNLAGPVEAGTTNGDVKVQASAVQSDGIRLDTTNGSIDLRIPANARANISAHWVHGDFEATGLRPQGQTEGRRYQGTLNGGGPRIELNTTNGQIRISS